MYVLDTLIAFSVQIETIKRPQKVSRIISEKILFFGIELTLLLMLLNSSAQE